MNTFVALRNINMFSKRKIIRINPPFIQENIQVRAGKCAHYILHRIYRILKNKDYFMFFWEFMVMNTFIALRYRHVFKAKNAQNESNFQSLTIVSFLHDNLINKWVMLTYTFQKYFHDLFQLNLISLHFSDWKWKLWRSNVSRNLLINVLKRWFIPKKAFKDHLIYLKDLKLSLNTVSECILCVLGFQMTYRTCSEGPYSLLHMYINHTLKSRWWQGYVRVCLQGRLQTLGFTMTGWTSRCYHYKGGGAFANW